MELKEFKKHIEGFPKGTQFKYGISEPFSWRGIYAEVAFEVLEIPMTREEILANIDLAYTKEFYGYKGGEYRYTGNTEVHFEDNYGSWTDGGYTARWIAKIEDRQEFRDNEERLIKIAFAS